MTAPEPTLGEQVLSLGGSPTSSLTFSFCGTGIILTPAYLAYLSPLRDGKPMLKWRGRGEVGGGIQLYRKGMMPKRTERGPGERSGPKPGG